MVEKHIKELLYDHDCVIIPDFGGLITRYVPARINHVKHSVTPPSKTVAFNEKLVLNDGLLISTIAHHNNISKVEAKRVVGDFVYQAKSTLQKENRFILNDIGVFKYNQERRLEFEYVEADNMLEASFGLPELVMRPVRVEEPAVLRTMLKERQQEQVHLKQPLRKRLKRAYNVAASLALTGLTVSALYFLSLQTEYNLSSLNPLMLHSSSFLSADESADRYASDYVPFTADERLAVYQAISPIAAEETLNGYEELDSNTLEVLLKTETLADSTESAVDEVVIDERKHSETPIELKRPELTIKDKTGRFYIITGGFSTLDNAQISQTTIRAQGHDSKVLVPGAGSRLYRVSVAEFDTKEEAQAALSNYKKSYGESIWVFNY